MRSLPTITPAADAPAPACADPSLTRRDFVSAATWSVLASALASACGGGDGGATGPTATGVTYANGRVSIPLASVPSLAQAGGFLITNGNGNNVHDASNRPADVIVINVGTDQWRAFTSVCTHDQCTVSDFTNGRIHCACHDSFYDTSGRNVAGPAPRPLQEFPLAYDAASRTLVVTRG